MNWALLAVALLAAEPADWPGFRGTGTSLTSAQELPLRWSTEENIAWQTDLPGYGQSSPVVVGSRVYVTAVQGDFKERLHVVAVELGEGKIAWQKEFAGTQKVKDSQYVSKAAPTPAADAAGVYALFESGDLIAMDHAGKLRWQRSLVKEYGKIEGTHGLGSSLAQNKDTLFVLVDHSGQSYLLAVDKKSGKNRWKSDRPQSTSWSTPAVFGSGDEQVVLTSGNGSVVAYAAKTGEKVWRVQGLDGNNVPSPTPAEGLVVIGAQDPNSNLAIRLGGKGDVAQSHVAWRARGASSSFGSPLVHRGLVYFVNRTGVVTCLDLKTGKEQWAMRLPGSTWASPLGADDRVYFFTKDGPVVVVAAGPELKKLAENQLEVDDRVYGVAAVNGAFVLRTGRKLICIGKPAPAAGQ